MQHSMKFGIFIQKNTVPNTVVKNGGRKTKRVLSDNKTNKYVPREDISREKKLSNKLMRKMLV